MSSVFHGLDGTEEGAEADFVMLGLLIDRLDGRFAVSFLFPQADLNLDQLCPDVELKLVQEGVVAGRGTHCFLQA